MSAELNTPVVKAPGERILRGLGLAGKWVVVVCVWIIQYGLVVPCYWLWRVIARSGWTILAICTLGISALIRGWFKAHGRNQRELVQAVKGQNDQAAIDTYNWRRVTRPWLKSWVSP